jgi:hypothetical protein
MQISLFTESPDVTVFLGGRGRNTEGSRVTQRV